MNLNKRAVAATFAIILAASLVGLAFHLNLAASSSVITVPDDYTSIQAAINAAHEGETILVRAGQYNENITVDKPLNLVGEDQKTTIINGSASVRTVVLVEANYVNISGFAIWTNHVPILSDLTQITSGRALGGIGLKASVGCNIGNNTIHGGIAGVAIAEGSGNTTVSDNSISTAFLNTAPLYWGIVSISPSPLISPFGGNTITDNNISSYASGIFVTVPNCEINGNQLDGNDILSSQGIILDGNYSSHSIVSNNMIINARVGIQLQREASDNVISNNTMPAGSLTLNGCSNNTLRGNNVSSFDVEGSELSDFLHDIDTSNTVNGRPIYYLVNQSNVVINPFTYPDAGYLGVVNSRNMSITRLTIANTQGLMLAQTTNSTIDEVFLSNGAEGIYLWNSSLNMIMGSTITSSSMGIDIYLSNNNTFRGNTILGNNIGVDLTGSGNNTFYRNNFMANGQHVLLTDQLSNKWDDRDSIYLLGCEGRPVGNYWDNYKGQDDGTKTPGLINYAGDGVGDTLLPHEGVDNYPLMKPWTPALAEAVLVARAMAS